ncbi:MAG: hypothetical protein DRQ02_12015 [Candidatus Latescibacterota bacterium]|nr:MAG: hypothetical protein DRQ02_12015 [Candidatus Latescibacterota bacterium]
MRAEPFALKGYTIVSAEVHATNLTERNSIGIGQLFSLVPEKTALVVVYVQKGFLQPGSVMEVPQCRELPPNIQPLVGLCRDKGMPITYSQLVHSANVPNLIGELHPEHRSLP